MPVDVISRRCSSRNVSSPTSWLAQARAGLRNTHGTKQDRTKALVFLSDKLGRSCVTQEISLAPFKRRSFDLLDAQNAWELDLAPLWGLERLRDTQIEHDGL